MSHHQVDVTKLNKRNRELKKNMPEGAFKDYIFGNKCSKDKNEQTNKKI